MEPTSNNNTLVKGLVGALSIAAIGGAAFYLSQDKEAGTVTPPQENAGATTTENGGTATATSTPSTDYKNGTYTATGNYTSPAGKEEVVITLTILNDKVVTAAFVGKGTHPTTMKMQGNFSAGFTQAVVGKPVDELALTVVNGSSLTPKGFADALVKIKAQARTVNG